LRRKSAFLIFEISRFSPDRFKTAEGRRGFRGDGRQSADCGIILCGTAGVGVRRFGVSQYLVFKNPELWENVGFLGVFFGGVFVFGLL